MNSSIGLLENPSVVNAWQQLTEDVAAAGRDSQSLNSVVYRRPNEVPQIPLANSAAKGRSSIYVEVSARRHPEVYEALGALPVEYLAEEDAATVEHPAVGLTLDRGGYINPIAVELAVADYTRGRLGVAPSARKLGGLTLNPRVLDGLNDGQRQGVLSIASFIRHDAEALLAIRTGRLTSRPDQERSA